jgi:hypothetical protein
MIKKLLLFPAFLLLGINVSGSLAQAPAGTLEVIATNGADHEKHLWSINGIVSMIMVRPNQTVPVTLQFTTDEAGTQVIAVPLDGGEIGGDDLLVQSTGIATFNFSPGPVPGRYRVEIHAGAEQHLLEFYVVDPNNPSRSNSQGSN